MGYESEVLSDGPVVWLPNGKKAENRPMELTEFLLARIAEDEAIARSANDPLTTLWDALQSLRDPGPFDPDRVLAECEAKRRIVEDLYYKIMLEFNTGRDDDVDGMLLRWLAFPYADHLDYLDEWRP